MKLNKICFEALMLKLQKGLQDLFSELRWGFLGDLEYGTQTVPVNDFFNMKLIFLY